MPWVDPIEWVRQPSYESCGIACVAMLADVDVGAALRAVFPGRRHFYGDTQTSSADLARGLRRLGVQCRLSEKFTRMERRHRVILGFDWQRSIPGKGHFVVWDPIAGRFWDPGYDRPWALRNDIYVRGFRRDVGYYYAVVAP